MSFKKKWAGKRKKEKSNTLRSQPIIGFRSNLHPITLAYIKKLAQQKQKSNFINQAIEQRYFMETNKKDFLKNGLEENYELCRALLRKIGNENSRKKSQGN